MPFLSSPGSNIKNGLLIYDCRNRGATNAELTQRVAYMEKIVLHYAGDIALDMESLRHLAESLDKTPDAVRNHRPGPVPDSPGSDYLGVDDENFTVQPLDNNTIRELIPLLDRHLSSFTNLAT